MWISVYEDLLAGHRRIFQDLQSRDRGPAMELNIQRLEVGLAFWTRQRDRVDAASLPLSKDSSTQGEPSQDPAPGLTQPGPQATALPVARPAK